MSGYNQPPLTPLPPVKDSCYSLLFNLDFLEIRSDDLAPGMRNPFPFFILLSVLGAKAATVTYTFESPEFTEYETTPLLNRAPQIGSSAFRADFTTFPSLNGLTVTTLPPSPMFSGQCILDGYPPPGADTGYLEDHTQYSRHGRSS
jgi:hypothetical protein